MFASFGTAAGSLDELTADLSATPPCRGRARARARHEPLHGHARALPLARPPGRADRLGRRLPLGRHRRREVGVGLQPRHHQPRRRHAACRRTARGEARADLPDRRLLRGRQPRGRPDRRLGRRDRGRRRPRTSSASPARRRVSRSCASPATATSTARSMPPSPRSANLHDRPEGALPFPSRMSSPPSTTRSPRCASALRCCSSSTSRDRWTSPSRPPRPSSARPRTRSRWRWITSPRATTSASPPSRKSRRRHRARAGRPVADIGSTRDAFLGALGGLQSMGDTPLYSGGRHVRRQQAQIVVADRITAIVLLSDGENDTHNADDRRRPDAREPRAPAPHTRCSCSRSRTARMPMSPRSSRSRARQAPTTTTPPTRRRSARARRPRHELLTPGVLPLR